MEELRGALTLAERKRIALQTELDDVRALLDAVIPESVSIETENRRIKRESLAEIQSIVCVERSLSRHRPLID